ncbi:extracellular solute-binding protein [Kiritimatiellaeota bacterium B1221]|nr:extracellular solute-binding protein [Kiritimatiellaeota bacterium B1221]
MLPHSLSPGSFTILTLAVVSSFFIFLRDDPQEEGLEFWMFAKNHYVMYQEEFEKAKDPKVNGDLIAYGAMERRLLSGVLSDTPVPDLVEVQLTMASRFFSGPIEAVGFTDLRPLLEAEGLDKRINPASFSPWTREGRIFGLPHDMHPVMLGYRADIVEAAGIDVNEIETWEDFVRILTPLMRDFDGDGTLDRYLLDLWETDYFGIEMLLLQAGGWYFDRTGAPAMNSDINIKVLATMVHWTTGPSRIGVNVPRFDAEGNRMRLEGGVIFQFMPDWYAGVMQQDVPGLAGKMKMMPLPAWEPGGRRTSCTGGTMLSIPRRAAKPEAAWEFAKKLYLGTEVAEKLYQQAMIVSPVIDNWDEDFYDEPIPYYSGQPVGRLYLELAPEIPQRVPSAFMVMAQQSMINAFIRTRRNAREAGVHEVEDVLDLARAELDAAQTLIENKMRRNTFLNPMEEQP